VNSILILILDIFSLNCHGVNFGTLKYLQDVSDSYDVIFKKKLGSRITQVAVLMPCPQYSLEWKRNFRMAIYNVSIRCTAVLCKNSLTCASSLIITNISISISVLV